MNTMLTNERKTELKPALSESYQSLFDQYYFSQSIYLLGDDLPERLRKAKSRHFLETTNSKRQKTELVSTKKRPSNSSDSLNYQAWKKNYSRHQQSRQNQRNSIHRYHKRN